MSIILALDTSTDACSVALNIHGKVTAYFEIAAQSHTQRLLPMVDEILSASHLKLTDLDAIAFGRGPGSFTGLRICAGIVQGLAFGASLRVIPVSTLQAMALQYFRVNPEPATIVVPSLDARMDEVYWAAYRRADDATLIAVTDEAVEKPDQVITTLTQYASTPIAAVGSGWQYPVMAVRDVASLNLSIQPRAEEIALLAAQAYEQGEFTDALGAQPVYLRDSVSWQKRKRIRDPKNLE